MNQKRKFDIDNRRFFQTDSTIKAVGDDNSTEFQISFASETPYKRWFGNEILSHKSGDVNYDILNNGGMFLFNHNANQYLGTVKKAWSEGTKSYAIVDVSSSSEFAKSILADIKNGTLKNISVGYEITNSDEIIKEMRTNDYDPNASYRIKWSPREISIAPVPADPTVGFGRSIELDENFKPPLEKNHDNTQDDINLKSIEETPKMIVQTNENKVNDDVIKSETERMSLIYSMAKKHNLDDTFVQKLVTECRSIPEVNEKLVHFFAERSSNIKITSNPDDVLKSKNINDEIGFSKKELKNFSISKAIMAKRANNWSQAGLEQEMSNAIRSKMYEQGINDFGSDIFIPIVNQRDAGPDAHMTSNLASAGTLIDTSFRMDMMLEYLRGQTIMLNYGAEIISDAVGYISIPIEVDPGEQSYWVKEGKDVGFGKLSYGRREFKPKTIGVIHELTDLMRIQAPGMDQRVTQAILYAIAKGIDQAILFGLGETQDQPLGIFNNPDILTHTLATSGKITFDDMLDMRTAVRNQKVNGTNCRYMTSPNVINSLQKIKSTNGEYLWTRSLDGGLSDGVPGAFNGIPVVENDAFKDQPTSSILYGDLSQIKMIMWGALGLKVIDQASELAKNGGIWIRALQHLDIALMRPEAICVAQGITK